MLGSPICLSRKQIASCSELHSLPNYSATPFTTDTFNRYIIISQEEPEWDLMTSYFMYIRVCVSYGWR